MLPIERQRQIKQILEANNTAKISELSHELQVSEMTIHRDIKPFIDQGYLIKTFGGVSLATSTPVTSATNEACSYCHRTLDHKMTYKLMLTNQQAEFACCAHCGLLRQNQLKDIVDQAICYDFLRQTTISVLNAFFVMDTSIDIGCCQPQVLSFEWRDHADKFVKGFGGKVYNFYEASDMLQCKMQDPNNSCHN